MSEIAETSWHSYPKVFNLGHPAIAELLVGWVLVEEKVDGSQFSFGVFDGEFRARSKNQQILVDGPKEMFAEAVEAVRTLPLRDGWTYRGEYLRVPKHGALRYARIPARHVILFDINDGFETYLSWDDKANEAARLGLEVVPRLLEGELADPSVLRAMLNTLSVLGGVTLEGVVVKNYARFGLDKKCLMGKHVSEEFKEVQKKEWRGANPVGKDVIARLIDEHRTQTRWRKAVQHLRDRGALTESPQDIGALMKEVVADIEAECAAEIKQALWQWAWPQIRRAVSGGLPEWYKQQLLDKQFESAGVAQTVEPLTRNEEVPSSTLGAGSDPSRT